MSDEILNYVHDTLTDDDFTALVAQGPAAAAGHLDTLASVRQILRERIAEAPSLAEQVSRIEADMTRVEAWLDAHHPDPTRAFLRELEELSRRHGLWICGSGRDLPLLRPGWGDEKGYLPMTRWRGHATDLAFKVDSAAEDWANAPVDQRGAAPEAIARIVRARTARAADER